MEYSTAESTVRSLYVLRPQAGQVFMEETFLLFHLQTLGFAITSWHTAHQ
jgi:hypothetical protein